MLLPEFRIVGSAMTLIRHIIERRQQQVFEMAELQRSLSDQGNHPPTSASANASYRSRASSVISTGTKFSIATLPQGHFSVDGMLSANASGRSTPRPGSPLSMRSIATSLPPYEGHQPHETHLSYLYRNGQPATGQNASIATDSQTTVNDSSQPTTPTDPENALSMHYGRIVRTIDENHARQLARVNTAHQQELAATRDAIDQAYRKEWKTKNREIERIREEAANEVEQVKRECTAELAAHREEIARLSAHYDETVARMQQDSVEKFVSLHTEHQAAIEKARHAIEDLWEGRWNDRTKIAADEAKRVAQDIERRDVERDDEWLQAIASVCPESMDDIRFAVMNARTQSKHPDKLESAAAEIHIAAALLSGDPDT